MSTTDEQPKKEMPEYYPPPNAIDVSPNKDGKVYKTIVEPGEGEEKPLKGDRVTVHYTGKLTDGTVFDSSVDRGEVFQFTLGNGEVIKAWDIGVATMRKGEKCILACDAEYAYGLKGSKPKIPPLATLIFDIELIKWQKEDLSPDNDHGILRNIIQEGEGYVTPSDGAIVEVHLVGFYNDKVFEERDIKYQVGEACEVGVVDGIDIAIKKFKKGEKSILYLSPKYAFGTVGNAECSIPPDSKVEYEVTLNSFEKEKESWNMSSEEKLEQSEIVKNKGTKYFKEGKYEVASKQYKRIISFLQYESELDGEGKEKQRSLLLAGYLNLAACYLKLENYPEVIQNCEKALEIDPKNCKGLFRKGQAHLALKDYETAKGCFTQVLETEASNKAAQKNIFVCNDYLKKQLEQEKKLYQAIFQKMSGDIRDQEPPAENGHFEKIETDDEKQAAAESVKV